MSDALIKKLNAITHGNLSDPMVVKMGDWNDALDEVRYVMDDLTAAKAENEALRGRVAELESGYTKLCNSASLARKILQDRAMRDGVTDVNAHANWGHLDTSEHEGIITKSNAWPWLRRKQAEAIEAWLHGEPEMGGLNDYAQRLRTQSDQLEAGGGDD